MIPNYTLSTLTKKIALSALAQYLGKAIQMVLGIIILKLISNFLTQGNYGLYAGISEYILFFSAVGNLGIFANIVRKMADEPKDGKIFAHGLFFRIVSAFALFIPAIFILLIGGSDAVFIWGTVFFASALFFDYITSVCDAMLQANYLMGRATFALVLGKIITFVSIYGMVGYLSASPHLAASPLTAAFILLCSLFGAFVTAALSLYFVRQKIKWSWKIDRAFLWDIFKTSLPFGIINILNNLYFRFLPDYFSYEALSDEQFASFNVAFRIAQVMSLFSTFLMFSVLPGFKEYIDQRHWQKAGALFKKISQILLVCGVLLVIGGSLFGEWAIGLLTDKKYFLPEFWFILPMMLFLAAVSYGYDLILITLFAFEQDRWLLKREVVALALSSAFFAGSLFISNTPLKVFFIILGAIVGEGFMVVVGMVRARGLLKNFQ